VRDAYSVHILVSCIIGRARQVSAMGSAVHCHQARHAPGREIQPGAQPHCGIASTFCFLPLVLCFLLLAVLRVWAANTTLSVTICVITSATS